MTNTPANVLQQINNKKDRKNEISKILRRIPSKTKKKRNNMNEDLVLPMPVNVQSQSAAQSWCAQQLSLEDGARFTYGDWVVNGDAVIFPLQGDPLVIRGAELRFGENTSKRGFGPVCLYAAYTESSAGGVYRDDKRNFEELRYDNVNRAITGTASGRTVVFRVYPYQTSRFRRLAAALGRSDWNSYTPWHCMEDIDMVY